MSGHQWMRAYLRVYGSLTISLLSLILLLGCEDGELASPQLVSSLRILGVKGEPPTVRPGQTVQLTALVGMPGDDKVSYTWHACKRNVAGGCQERKDARPLGDKATVSYKIPDNFLPKQLSLLDQFRGVYLTINLVVKSGDQTQIATKRIVVSGFSANSNPIITKCSLFENGKKTPLEEPWEVEAGKTYKFVPTADESKREDYAALTNEGKLHTVKEALFYSWYTTGGSLRGRTSSEKTPEKVWVAPKEPGKVDLFLILRDGRGGTDWLKRTILVK